MRKLTLERIEELKKLVQEEQDKYKLVMFSFSTFMTRYSSAEYIVHTNATIFVQA